MWKLPTPGIKPESPALAGGALTTGPPGKPWKTLLYSVWVWPSDFLSWPLPSGSAAPLLGPHYTYVDSAMTLLLLAAPLHGSLGSEILSVSPPGSVLTLEMLGWNHRTLERIPAILTRGGAGMPSRAYKWSAWWKCRGERGNGAWGSPVWWYFWG